MLQQYIMVETDETYQSMFKSALRKDVDQMMNCVGYIYKRAQFMADNTVLTMMRALNSLCRNDPYFVTADLSSRLVPELVQGLQRIQADDKLMTRFYHVRKFFITTIRDQVSDQDFLLHEEWASSHYNSNSNMQVFYSSKNRYYMLNLMVLEPILRNENFVDYASSQ